MAERFGVPFLRRPRRLPAPDQLVDGKAGVMVVDQTVGQESAQPPRLAGQGTGGLAVVERGGDVELPAVSQAAARQGGSRADDGIGVLAGEGPVQQAPGQVTVIA